jgi:predicted TIM-barrel fold metal-dependent hydrolase
MIVDSQIHIWAPDSPERPWQFGTALRDPPVTAEEVAAVTAAAGVDRVVLVPLGWDGDRNDLALAAAARWPDRFAIMGRIKLDDAAAPALVRRWRDQPGMKGLRLSPGAARESANWLVMGSADWLWPLCEAERLPVMIHAPSQLPLVGRIAERFPRLPVIVDHMGLAMPHPGENPFRYFDDLIALAALPNVAVKASALPCYVAEPYPFPTLHRYIRRAYEAFGPQRLFWGSDYGRLTSTYEENLALFRHALPWLSDDDKSWILGRAICRWLDWPV